jgi:hypothetical protein
MGRVGRETIQPDVRLECSGEIVTMMDGVTAEAEGLEFPVPEFKLAIGFAICVDVMTQVRFLRAALALAFRAKRIHSQV